MEPHIKRYRWLLLGLLCLAAAAVLVQTQEGFAAQVDRLIGPNSQCSWPTVKGSIAGSEMENRVHANGEDDWGFMVRFTYDIDGSRYSASQWLRDFLVVPPDVPKFREVPYLFQVCAKLRDVTEAVALFRAAHDESRFFPSRPAVVYFNPGNRDEAVLVPGLVFDGPMSYGEVIWLYGSLSLFFGGIIMLVAGIRSRRGKSPMRTADVPAAARLMSEIADLETQRAAVLQGRPHSGATGLSFVLQALGLTLVVFFGLLFFCPLALAQEFNPAIFGGFVLGLGLLVAFGVLGRRLRSDIKSWDADHREQLKTIDEQIAAKTAELRRFKQDSGA